MNQIRLKHGLHFWWDTQEYIISKRLSNGNLQICQVDTKALSSLSEEALLKFYFKDEIQFFPPTDSSNSGKKNNYKSTDFTQVEADLKEEAKREYEYIKAYLEQNTQKRDRKTLEPIIQQVATKISDTKPPYWTTFYRWLIKYEQSGGDIRSLIKKNIAKGNSQPKINSEIVKIIDDVIEELYLSPQKPSIANIYSEIVIRVTSENLSRKKIGLDCLRIPHRSAVYRRAAKLDPYKETVSRYGKKVADRTYSSAGQKPPQPTRPLQIVEIDHTKLPFFVIARETNLPIGIPSLTIAIDRFTEIPVGYYLSFEPFSGLSVMQCLWHAIRPKTYVREKYPAISHTWSAYGVMELLKCDNAMEFGSEQLRDAALGLGITIEFTPPKMPWYKACVERQFRTWNTMLLGGQPGSYLKFIQEYADEYDPVKNAVVTLDALHEMIHLFIIDVVAQMSHSKYGTPRAEVWQTSTLEFPPALPSSSRDLRILLGELHYRVISKNGIEFEGLFYKNSELLRLRSIYEQRDKRRTVGARDKEKAKIKINPTDISCIYVFDPISFEFIEVPAVDITYTKGLSRWQHKVIRRLAAQESSKVDIVALSLAKKKIQEIVDREWRTHKRGKTRISMARWLGIGRDGIDLSDIESFVMKQGSPTSESEVENSTLYLDISSSSFTSICGISNFKSAFNSSEALVSCNNSIDNNELKEFEREQKPIEFPLQLTQSIEALPNKPTESKIKKTSTGKLQTEREPQQSKHKLQLESNSNLLWNPDLSEWSADYRL